jgi:S1-C subfamily serine protease
MGLYELPQLNRSKINNFFSRFFKNRSFTIVVAVIVLSSVFGFVAGFISSNYFYSQIKSYLEKFNIDLPSVVEKQFIQKEYIPQTTQEEAIIKAVKDFSPAVVSIVISKDVPIMEEYFYNPFEEFGPLAPDLKIPQYRQKGTEKKEIGGGTGFVVSSDGLILTNKHVVLDKDAEYTVFTNDGKKYPAKVLAKDPIQDLAVIKIDQEKAIGKEGEFIIKSFPVVKLGDSDNLQIGQTVIAIGNALGEFRNTVSVGVISGLGRTVSASGGGLVETLEDIIQTDAAINKGNSGGPLLNLKGEVIGINTAIALEAQSIGFAIPINKAKRDIEQIKTTNKIVYPFLGVRYVLVNEKVKEKNNLSVDYGALIIKGENGESAVTPGSAAEKAGLKENDIILEFNGEKITTDNSLAKIIIKYNPGDQVTLKILRETQEGTFQVTLGERSE